MYPILNQIGSGQIILSQILWNSVTNSPYLWMVRFPLQKSFSLQFQGVQLLAFILCFFQISLAQTGCFHTSVTSSSVLCLAKAWRILIYLHFYTNKGKSCTPKFNIDFNFGFQLYFFNGLLSYYLFLFLRPWFAALKDFFAYSKLLFWLTVSFNNFCRSVFIKLKDFKRCVCFNDPAWDCNFMCFMKTH